jgi:ATP-dependent DNA helicase PIF1
MRVREGVYGPDFVRWVGDIPYNPAYEFMVQIPNYIDQPRSIDDLINCIYPVELLRQAITNPTALSGRCLLSILNTTVTELNSIILQRLPGLARTYLSLDIHVTDGVSDDLHEFPVEQLQSIDLPSLPPSRLNLKIGTPVMLLRNLCPQDGLCNGTRMVITNLRSHCIEARILGGDFDSQLRLIPRIKLTATDPSLGIEISRKQFPIRISFAMTINKSQGQSFHTVGLDLRTPVFTHGQLYVGVSRTLSVEGLSILLPIENQGQTPNIVFPEVLVDIR